MTAKGTFRILGCGKVRKWVKYSNEVIKITFENALHTSDLDHNLMSIGSLVQKGVKLGIDERGAMLRAPDSKPFMMCPISGTMFIIEFMPLPPSAMVTRSLHHSTDLETWHHQLGHIGESTVREMICRGTVEGLATTKMLTEG